MRWRRTIPAPSSHRHQGLDRECEQLEQLISRTTNQSIAEMARIKLRVARYFRRLDRLPEVDQEHRAGEDPVEVELPRSTSIAPTAHLIDLTRQQPMLDKIKLSAPHPVPASPPIPMTGIEPFYANTHSFRSVTGPSSRLLNICLVYAVLIGMFGLLAIFSSPGTPSPTTIVCATLIPLLPLAVLVYLHLVTPRSTGPAVSIDWDGVRLSHRLWHWHAIETITVAMREGACDCEVQMQNGRVIVATMVEFQPSTDEWLRRLWYLLNEHAPATGAIARPVEPVNVHAAEMPSQKPVSR